MNKQANTQKQIRTSRTSSRRDDARNEVLKAAFQLERSLKRLAKETGEERIQEAATIVYWTAIHSVAPCAPRYPIGQIRAAAEVFRQSPGRWLSEDAATVARAELARIEAAIAANGPASGSVVKESQRGRALHNAGAAS